LGVLGRNARPQRSTTRKVVSVNPYQWKWQTRLALEDIYLLLDVVKGIWRINGETDQDDVGIWV
jgi:hypothetical protein